MLRIRFTVLGALVLAILLLLTAGLTLAQDDAQLIDTEEERTETFSESLKELGDGALLTLSGSGFEGLHVDVEDKAGIYVSAGAYNGIVVDSTKDDGIVVNNAAFDGIKVYSSIQDGIQVNDAGDHGIEVRSAGDDGLHVADPGDDGLEVYFSTYTGKNGVEIVRGNIRVIDGSFIDDGTTLNVPDYVFENDYTLMSLNNLREFVEVNKHLPNMPSENDIKADGLDLAAFNMRLLEKVEEQTLYILELEARLATIEQQLDKDNLR